MTVIQDIISKLGLNGKDGLFYLKDNQWKEVTSFPNRVQRLLELRIKPQAIFCFDNKPLILFFENPKNKEALHEAIWNFNESPIAIIIEEDSVEIFNGFNFHYNEKTLEKLGGIEKLTNFNYFELVTGKAWEEYQEQLNYKNRVDFHLLQNIKAARRLLVEVQELNSKIANAIIGKVIFARYLIDRKIKINFDGILRTWTNDEFCNLLDEPSQIQAFFAYLEDSERGFNGDLFPIATEEYQNITNQHYQVLKRLLKGNDIEQGQPSLFDFYDFSIIPIEFISNVYELFIGQNNQEEEGAYYTPLFLVDYILKETVEKKINATDDFSCKVLDPACGSGIFLVETLRKIIEKHIETGVDTSSEVFKEKIKNLAKENIFGVDKDLSAIQVAIFSIYLTLLDYLDPPAIEGFKFPPLFGKNFFESDFFNEESTFNVIFKDVEFEFDFILGNPPWKGGGMKDLGKEYLKNRKKKEKRLSKKFDIAINNNEIAEGFVLRVSDFCSKNTKVSLIIRSSSLYNLGYNKSNKSAFRQYWLEEFHIDKIFELAPVRHEVFEKSNDPAIAPAAILFYRYAHGENTDNNIVKHITLKQSRFFSLFKIFTINRNDYKFIKQKMLTDFDWLWKVLVYGSYLDFNFIKRIKDDYSSIKDVIEDNSRFIESTGLHSRTEALESPKDTSLIADTPLIKTGAINSFHIDYEKKQELEVDKIDIIKDVRIYKSPMLLVREGIDLDSLTAKCAIATKNILFKDSITSIKYLKNEDINVIYDIAAILSSDLFTYYSISTFVSVGIERERAKNYNKYSLPYLNINVENNIKIIEQAKQEIYLENKDAILVDNLKIENLNSTIKNQLITINESISKKLDLSDIEYSLLEYALEVNRTFIIGTEEEKARLFASLTFDDNILNSYAQLFLEQFKTKLDKPDKKFITEIWYTEQIIGVFFRIIPTKEYIQDIVWINKQNAAELLTFASSIGTEKITDKLFVQKDIRGFSGNGEDFFIIKPNEKRLWYKAIGYADVNEFSDAIIKAGRRS